jgi:hypothetical protein
MYLPVFIKAAKGKRILGDLMIRILLEMVTAAAVSIRIVASCPNSFDKSGADKFCAFV